MLWFGDKYWCGKGVDLWEDAWFGELMNPVYILVEEESCDSVLQIISGLCQGRGLDE
jgi:hypothetical protein